MLRSFSKDNNEAGQQILRPNCRQVLALNHPTRKEFEAAVRKHRALPIACEEIAFFSVDWPGQLMSQEGFQKQNRTDASYAPPFGGATNPSGR